MTKKVAALVLAAGLSTRMGSPKMVLPWGDSPVICRVVDVLDAAGVSETLVITGGARRQVEAALAGSGAQTIYNPDHQRDSMILSLQVGLANLSGDISAFLVVLGDQPQIQVDVVRAVIAAYDRVGAELVMPSFNMRRGHPWLVDRALWGALMALQPAQTMRDFINAHTELIQYVQVESDSILRDIDNPADYNRERPAS